MTKEEIISEISGYSSIELTERKTEPLLQPNDVMLMMEEYGRQCFEAGKEAGYESYLPKLERIKPMVYDDYLKELDNE